MDAERAVLAACLLDPGAVVPEVRTHLQADHFYADRHRRIYAAVLALDDASETIDLVTVAAELRRTERLAQAGGTAYLAELADATPAVRHVDAHVALVLARAKQRAIIGLAQRLASEGYGDVGDVSEWCSDAVEQLSALADHTLAEDTLQLASDISGPVYDQLRQSHRGEAPTILVPTGYPQLDRGLGGGYARSSMAIIGGRPGHGKTSFALDSAIRVAERGEGVAYFSLEMVRQQLLVRAWSLLARVDNNRVTRGEMNADQWRKLAAAVEQTSRLPLVIDDRPVQSLASLRAAARRAQGKLRRRHGVELSLLVVDYLQIMRGDRQRGDSREREVAALSTGMLWLARELGCAVVVLSQLNRDKTRKTWQSYQLEDLRESGAIEQDAFAVLFVHRDDAEQQDDSRHDNMADIVLAKVRQGGRRGRVTMHFDGPTTSFREIADYADDLPEF